MPGSQASGNKEEMLGRDYTIGDDLFRRKYRACIPLNTSMILRDSVNVLNVRKIMH